MYGYLKFAFKSIMPTKLISMNPFLLCWPITFGLQNSLRLGNWDFSTSTKRK